ncbi:MAG: hypothetical protein GY941_20365 [Planctomycetes bacterium]|nr:hypothetical protein [Planctomycetota bacterium]
MKLENNGLKQITDICFGSKKRTLVTAGIIASWLAVSAALWDVRSIGDFKDRFGLTSKLPTQTYD